MISQPAPAMKEERPLAALTLLVGEVHVIEPPGWADAGRLGIRFLLPVEPPEIYALLFERMVKQVHVIHRELLICDIEGHIFLSRWVDTHCPRHCWIRPFPRLYA